MRKTLLLAALFTGASFGQNIVGDWSGSLKSNGVELRLVLHVTTGSGGLGGTLDSVDQGANGLPVSAISFKDSKLKFEVGVVRGEFEGTLSPDGNSIAGQWTQGKALPLTLHRGGLPPAALHKPATPSDIDGAWTGIIDTGRQKLRVVFHITNTADGLISTLDSPDQGGAGIPVTSVTRNASSLKLEVKPIAGRFEGTISGQGTIDGTWIQGPNSFPLNLKRGK